MSKGLGKRVMRKAEPGLITEPRPVGRGVVRRGLIGCRAGQADSRQTDCGAIMRFRKD